MNLPPSITGRSATRRLLAWIGCAAGLVLGLSLALGADAGVSLEYKVKAAFLYNFTKFVDWPTSAFAGAESPLVIGVCGKSPFGPELEQGVRGKAVNGRVIELRACDTPEAAKAVHLLFIPAGEDARVGAWLEALAGTSVLTVGETDRFADAGGIIRFLREADKVRFDINIEAAESAKLRISSQLQKLARAVRKTT